MAACLAACLAVVFAAEIGVAVVLFGVATVDVGGACFFLLELEQGLVDRVEAVSVHFAGVGAAAVLVEGGLQVVNSCSTCWACHKTLWGLIDRVCHKALWSLSSCDVCCRSSIPPSS